jgi:glycerol-3-phosphate dehydrogenase (NAD(P)+)
MILFCVPSKALKDVMDEVSKYLLPKKEVIILNACKGFVDGNLTPYQAFKTHVIFNQFNYVSILGPSHAEEVILRKLTFLNLCGTNDFAIKRVGKALSSDYIKCKSNKYIFEAELCVAFKNIIAIVCGIFSGLGYGDNAKAALYTIGLNEMQQMLNLLGGSSKAVMELAGCGDLAVTCYSNNSRNFTAGRLIGELNSYEDFIKTNNKTIEGLNAVDYFNNMLQQYNSDSLIIISLLQNIKQLVMTPEEAVKNLLKDKSENF